ncbi:Uncharacterized protein GBIM_18979 [Gryllus bimaculatus]|nr:Uncharacterized protein GBIM_18979 [Gryllus bimaculatus]
MDSQNNSVAPSGAAMSLPVSSYEELLARVRSLTHETIQLQRELASPLLQPGHGLGHGPAHAATATTVDLNDNAAVDLHEPNDEGKEVDELACFYHVDGSLVVQDNIVLVPPAPPCGS